MKLHSSFQRFADATNPDRLHAAFAAALRQRYDAGASLTDLQVSRVLPRAVAGFTIQYRIAWHDAAASLPRPLLWCGHLLGPDEPWPEHRATSVVLEDLRLVVPVFPFDPALVDLEASCTPEIERARLRELGAQHPLVCNDVAWTSEVLSYRLERRCVIRCRSAAAPQERGVVVKAIRPRRVAMAHQALARVECVAADGFAIPTTLAVDPIRGRIYSEESPGVAVHDLGPNADVVAAYAAAGRALRALHALPIGAGREATVGDELDRLRARVELAGRMFPDSRETFEAAWLAMVEESAVLPPVAARTWIHGDFYDKQVLFDPDRTTVLDWDEMALGDPARDHGNFLAHVHLRAQQHPQRSVAFHAGGHAFERGYGVRDDNFVVRSRWWCAAALVRLATLYALRPLWRSLALPLLETSRCIHPESRRRIES